MTWPQLGALVLTFLTAFGGLVAAFVRLRSEVAEQGRSVEGLRDDLDKVEPMRDRVIRLEERFDGLVQAMEQRDERASADRLEILSAIQRMGTDIKAVAEKLEGKIDALANRVYQVRPS